MLKPIAQQRSLACFIPSVSLELRTDLAARIVGAVHVYVKIGRPVARVLAFRQLRVPGRGKCVIAGLGEAADRLATFSYTAPEKQRVSS